MFDDGATTRGEHGRYLVFIDRNTPQPDGDGAVVRVDRELGGRVDRALDGPGIIDVRGNDKVAAAHVADLGGYRLPLLQDKVHNRHDRGRLRQLDAKFLHNRPEVLQELIERPLALPDIEDLKVSIFTEA